MSITTSGEAVVSPLGRLTVEALDENSGLANLAGKKIAFVWDLLFSGDKMMEEIQHLLADRHSGIEFVGHENFENVHGPEERRVVAELPGLLEAMGVDAAVIGVGACGSCTPAENNLATSTLGWETIREEMGFDASETVVAVQSMMGSTLPIYSGGHGPENHLQLIAEHIAGTIGHWSYLGVMFHEWWPVVVMSPAIAQVLADSGMSKDDVRLELAERSRVPARMWEEYPWQVGTDGFKLAESIERGEAPPAYSESADRDRMIPTLSYPEQVGIVIAGDPERNQSRFLVNNHEHGPRIGRAAQLLS
jgi:hypothetical protein